MKSNQHGTPGALRIHSSLFNNIITSSRDTTHYRCNKRCLRRHTFMSLFTVKLTAIQQAFYYLIENMDWTLLVLVSSMNSSTTSS